MNKILKKLRVLKFRNDTMKMLAIFFFSFLVLFFVFNFSAIFSSINYSLKGGNEEAQNEMLTNMYREMYGYEARIKRGEITEETYSSPVPSGVDNSATVLYPTNANNVNNAASINNATANTLATQPGQVIAGNYIYIPKINVRAPIVFGKSTDQNRILKDLKSGVLLYPGSTVPGGNGTTVIVGHSSSNSPTAKYGTVFSLLNKLVVGDTIQISYSGVNYIYQINGKRTGSAQELANASTGEDLILGTCWPIGTDKGRIVVTASLLTRTN